MSDFLDLSNINIISNNLISEDKFPILRGLSPLNIRILNGSSRLIDIDQGVETLHEGDNPRDLYFIRKGCVSIAKGTGQQRKNIACLKSGDIFGEFAILRNKPRYASVYTAETCELVRVSAPAVHQVLEADHDFKDRLQRILSQRLLNSFFFSHPIFQTLPGELRLKYSQDLETGFLYCDTEVLKQGEECKGIAFLLSGNVEVYHKDAMGKEHLLEIRRNHDVLGELSSNKDNGSAYSAIAASDLDILQLNQNVLVYIKKSHPETLKRLELYIQKRAQLTAKRLSEGQPDE